MDDESGYNLQNKLSNEYGKGRVQYIRCDIMKEDQLFGAFNVVIDRHGYIDIVVNNAGLADTG